MQSLCFNVSQVITHTHCTNVSQCYILYTQLSGGDETAYTQMTDMLENAGILHIQPSIALALLSKRATASTDVVDRQ
jgi:hypothetical protein